MKQTIGMLQNQAIRSSDSWQLCTACLFSSRGTCTLHTQKTHGNSSQVKAKDAELAEVPLSGLKKVDTG